MDPKSNNYAINLWYWGYWADEDMMDYHILIIILRWTHRAQYQLSLAIIELNDLEIVFIIYYYEMENCCNIDALGQRHLLDRKNDSTIRRLSLSATWTM